MTTALVVAAIALVISLVIARIWQLPKDATTDLAPSNHCAEPVMAVRPEGDRGPVLIEIEYKIEPQRFVEFTAALRKFSAVRYRDDAIRWDVWEDVAVPGRVVEAFIVESWIEHQRQHARVTHSDQLNQSTINDFHLGDNQPVARHLLKPV